MALYLIGDVQGCDAALQGLLDSLDFSPSRDTLYLLGDLVNRGPASDLVLRRLMGYGTSAKCLLGNHDLHLLAVVHGARKPHRKDTLNCILHAPDRDTLLHWLTHQHLAMQVRTKRETVLLVHAGVLPSWSAVKTLALAAEVEAMLQSSEAGAFFHAMYGDQPSCWDESLGGIERLRVIVNALTRLRFCAADGTMEFATKEGSDGAPPGYMPWFEVPGRATSGDTIAFGHWSTLGWLHRTDVLSMDTGCVWGGALSALRLGESPTEPLHTLFQVACEASQRPGK